MLKYGELNILSQVIAKTALYEVFQKTNATATILGDHVFLFGATEIYWVNMFGYPMSCHFCPGKKHGWRGSFLILPMD